MRDIVILVLVIFIVFGELILVKTDNELKAINWALEETGRDFSIQRGMLHRCETLLSECRAP